jgi:hypothetical protein
MERGKKSESCLLVLGGGPLEILATSQEFRSEAGPWQVLGLGKHRTRTHAAPFSLWSHVFWWFCAAIEAILNPDGFYPDFSVKVTHSTRVLCIDYRTYNLSLFSSKFKKAGAAGGSSTNLSLLPLTEPTPSAANAPPASFFSRTDPDSSLHALHDDAKHSRPPASTTSAGSASAATPLGTPAAVGPATATSTTHGIPRTHSVSLDLQDFRGFKPGPPVPHDVSPPHAHPHIIAPASNPVHTHHTRTASFGGGSATPRGGAWPSPSPALIAPLSVSRSTATLHPAPASGPSSASNSPGHHHRTISTGLISALHGPALPASTAVPAAGNITPTAASAAAAAASGGVLSISVMGDERGQPITLTPSASPIAPASAIKVAAKPLATIPSSPSAIVPVPVAGPTPTPLPVQVAANPFAGSVPIELTAAARSRAASTSNLSVSSSSSDLAAGGGGQGSDSVTSPGATVYASGSAGVPAAHHHHHSHQQLPQATRGTPALAPFKELALPAPPPSPGFNPYKDPNPFLPATSLSEVHVITNENSGGETSTDLAEQLAAAAELHAVAQAQQQAAAQPAPAASASPPETATERDKAASAQLLDGKERSDS